MKGFRLTVNLEEYHDEGFKFIKGQIEVCNHEDLGKTFNKLITHTKHYIKNIDKIKKINNI